MGIHRGDGVDDSGWKKREKWRRKTWSKKGLDTGEQKMKTTASRGGRERGNFCSLSDTRGLKERERKIRMERGRNEEQPRKK